MREWAKFDWENRSEHALTYFGLSCCEKKESEKTKIHKKSGRPIYFGCYFLLLFSRFCDRENADVKEGEYTQDKERRGK